MDRSELKRQAVQYYNQNEVPKQLETLLNTMFADQPVDIYGYMAEFFKKLSKPASISKITVESVLSRSGYDTLRAGISCIVNGIEQDVSSLEFFKDGRPLSTNKTAISTSRSSAKQGGKKDAKGGSKGGNKKEVLQATEEASRETPLVPKCTSFNKERASMYLLEEFVPKLIGSTLNEDDIDGRIKECCQELKGRVKKDANLLRNDHHGNQEEPRISIMSPTTTNQSTTQPHSPIEPSTNASKGSLEKETEINMVSFLLSTLCAVSRCQVENRELYKSLINRKSDYERKKCPMPAISFFSSSNSSPGKLCMVKELLVLPKPGPDLKEGIEALLRLYRSFENTLSVKFVANGIVRNGCGLLTPPFDKIEQIFEYLLQAFKSEFDCEFADLFDVILNVGANGLYDVDKKKYEVCIGSSKTTDEMVSLYQSWIHTYSIIALIDPLSPMDVSGQTSLYTELAPHCFIITSQFTDFEHVNGFMKEAKSDGILFQPELYCQTLSEADSKLQELRESNGVLVMTDEWCTVQASTLAVDMAFSLGAKFLRISSPVFGGAASAQRFLEIYESESITNETQHYPYVFRVNVKNGEDEENSQEEGEQLNGER